MPAPHGKWPTAAVDWPDEEPGRPGADDAVRQWETSLPVESELHRRKATGEHAHHSPGRCRKESMRQLLSRWSFLGTQSQISAGQLQD